MSEIGSSLREARMRARIDIGEVETSTKIRAKYLRAIENEEWDLLPGPVYIKSFLRTYGDYLGLDSRMLVDEFKRRYEYPSEHEQRSMSSIARERERASRSMRGPLVPPWALIGGILVIVVAALFVIGELSGNNASSPTPPVTAGGTTHNHGKSRSHSGSHHSTTTPTTPTTVRTTASTTTRTKTTPAAPANATLQITPTAPVWICVEKVVHGTATPAFPAGTFLVGQSVPTATARELLVTLGNANVTLKANGKPYPLTSSPTAIGLKVTPTQVGPLPAGTAPPTCG